MFADPRENTVSWDDTLNPVTLAVLGRSWQSISTAIHQRGDEFDLHEIVELCREAYEDCKRLGLESRLARQSRVDWHNYRPIPADPIKEGIADLDRVRTAYKLRAKRAPTLGLINADLGTFWDCVMAAIDTAELAGIQEPIDQAQSPLLASIPFVGTTVGDPVFLRPPGFLVAQENVSGTEQFRIRLSSSGKGGKLTVYVATNADVDGFTWSRDIVHVFLTYGQQALKFTETTIEGSLIQVVLTVDTLADFKQLREIISDPALDAKLVVRWITERRVPTNQMDLVLVPEDETERQELVQNLATEAEELRDQLAALARQEASLLDGDEQSRQEKERQLNLLERQLRTLQNPVPLCVTWPFVFDQVVRPERFAFDQSLYPYIFAPGS